MWCHGGLCQSLAGPPWMLGEDSVPHISHIATFLCLYLSHSHLTHTTALTVCGMSRVIIPQVVVFSFAEKDVTFGLKCLQNGVFWFPYFLSINIAVNVLAIKGWVQHNSDGNQLFFQVILTVEVLCFFIFLCL